MISKICKCGQCNLICSDMQGDMESFQRCDSKHFSYMWLPEVPQNTLKRVQPFFFFLFKARNIPFPAVKAAAQARTEGVCGKKTEAQPEYIHRFSSLYSPGSQHQIMKETWDFCSDLCPGCSRHFCQSALLFVTCWGLNLQKDFSCSACLRQLLWTWASSGLVSALLRHFSSFETANSGSHLFCEKAPPSPLALWHSHG